MTTPLPLSAITAEKFPARDAIKLLLQAKRATRKRIVLLDECIARAGAGRRMARVLKEQGSPFNHARIAKLEAEAEEWHAHADTHRGILRDIGQCLTDCAWILDTSIPRAQLCDLLEINQVDRAAIEEDAGFISIVMGHCLEESAARRSDDYCQGPLFRALHLAFARFLETDSGKKLVNSAFEPGGPLEWLPMYRTGQNGEMVRLPPPLRVVP